MHHHHHGAQAAAPQAPPQAFEAFPLEHFHGRKPLGNWIMAVVMALLTAYNLLLAGLCIQDRSYGMIWLFALIALFCAWMSWHCVGLARDGRAVVSVGPEGINGRRLARAVAWSEIDDIGFRQYSGSALQVQGGMLYLNLKPASDYPVRFWRDGAGHRVAVNLQLLDYGDQQKVCDAARRWLEGSRRGAPAAG